MRILYDGMTYVQQEAGGINRYFANLISRLPDHVEPTLTTARLRALHFPQHPRLRVRYFKRFAFRPGRLSFWMEKHYFRHYSRGHDIVHPTYYATLAGIPWRSFRAKIVVTVYDLIHERFATRFDLPDPHANAKKDAIQAADAIVCISESTRRDLLEFYPVDPAKVHVVYLASEFDARLADAPGVVPEPPYLLYVGGRDYYKNFDALLRAFGELAPAYPRLGLCVVGSTPVRDTERARLVELGIQDRVRFLGGLDDAQLARVYRHAEAFVYPSIYEGFGIPPLEAMACGTPVVVADRSSLPEVVGDAGVRFDPDAPAGLTEAIDGLLRSPQERGERIRRGLLQQGRFSWDRMARQTMDVYEQVLS